MSGFIQLSREFFKSKEWKERRSLSDAEAMLYMISKAGFEAKTELHKGKYVRLQAGELMASERFLAEKWSWSKSKARRFLDRIERIGYIGRRTEKGEGVIRIKRFIVGCEPANEPVNNPDKRLINNRLFNKVVSGSNQRTDQEPNQRRTTDGPANGPANGPGTEPVNNPDKRLINNRLFNKVVSGSNQRTNQEPNQRTNQRRTTDGPPISDRADTKSIEGHLAPEAEQKEKPPLSPSFFPPGSPFYSPPIIPQKEKAKALKKAFIEKEKKPTEKEKEFSRGVEGLEIEKKEKEKTCAKKEKEKEAVELEAEACGGQGASQGDCSAKPSAGKLKGELRYPFGSERFKQAWEEWKLYKRAEHGFKYKSPLSEQTALNQLGKKARGDEAVAFEIIEQSMANGWEGLFELKDRRASPSGLVSRDQLPQRPFSKNR